VASPLVALGARSARQTMRSPQFLAPVLVLPTLFLVAYAGGVASGDRLPGFPGGASVFEYQLGGVMLLSAMMAGVIGGIAQVLDIQFRFLDRLLLAPAARTTIVLGRLAGTGILGLLGGLVFVVIGLVFGADLAGPAGILWMLVLQALTAVAFGAVTAGVALRTSKANAVQVFLPLGIVLTMFSSAFFPRDLLRSPMDAIATVNPLTYLADALHGPWIGGTTGTVFVRSVIALAVLAAIGALLCGGSLSARAQGR
jgi:ABC-2 type transport system permease protein